MTDDARLMDRREATRMIAAAVPLAVALDFTPLDVVRAARALADFRRRGQRYQPRFFTAHEWETVRLLVDLIIPADERSGSATEAGVPEFMDFIMTDSPARQTAMRGGLAWLDAECRERFGTPSFAASSETERRAVLEDIAWPAQARPDLSHGVAFFNGFRDLTASGFWSSSIGVEDLRYIGNTAVPDWNGCPEEQLGKLGVRYE